MTGKRILVVDDDRAFVEAVALFLEDHGFRATTAVCGRDGLEALRRGGIDLAVIDVHMPDINGLDVAKQTAALAEPIPVIFISGDETQEAPARSCQAEVQAFLTKPLSPDELLCAISDTLDKWR